MPEWLQKLIERRQALKDEAAALLDAKNEDGESRDLTEDEDTQFESLMAEIKKIDARVAEWQEQEAREAAAAAHRVELGISEPRATVTSEPNPVYRKDDNSTSFFRDLASQQLNTPLAGSSITEARERLTRAQETRAGDMSSVAGKGLEFAPPAWLVSDFAALARPGRITADLCNTMTLPSGISSINYPKVASGVTAAVQQTQNSALSDTAMTTTSVSSGITTVGGKQIISMQLLQQSGIPFDRVVLGDLAKAYAVQVDTQVLYGSNANGQLNGLVNVATNNAFTSASPAPASVTNANSFLYVVTKATAALQTTIYQQANALILHPNRWAWIAGAVDTQGRPYIVPNGNNFNPLGTSDGIPVQGPAGFFGSLPVYVDPNVSVTANGTSGTTAQDEAYIVRRDELHLFESPVQTASFDATYADNASVLFRILGYLAFIPNRYTGAVQSIRGTGMLLP